MGEFTKALNDVIASCSNLTEAWEKLDDEASSKILEKYPFDKDFREIISDLVNWRESL